MVGVGRKIEGRCREGVDREIKLGWEIDREDGGWKEWIERWREWMER